LRTLSADLSELDELGELDELDELSLEQPANTSAAAEATAITVTR
jgi:hypothetical protein